MVPGSVEVGHWLTVECEDCGVFDDELGGVDKE